LYCVGTAAFGEVHDVSRFSRRGLRRWWPDPAAARQ